MAAEDWSTVAPDAVLGFWFPDDGHDAQVRDAPRVLEWRMRGGADDTIRERFSDLTDAAAGGCSTTGPPRRVGGSRS